MKFSTVKLILRIKSMVLARVYLKMDSVTKVCMKMIKWLEWASRSIQILLSIWVSIKMVKDMVVESYSCQTVENMKETGEKIVCMVKVMKDYQMDRVIWFTQIMEIVSIVSLKERYEMEWHLAIRGRLQDHKKWDFLTIHKNVNLLLIILIQTAEEGHMECRVVTIVNQMALKI